MELRPDSKILRYNTINCDEHLNLDRLHWSALYAEDSPFVLSY